MKPKFTKYIIRARDYKHDVSVGVYTSDALGNAINAARKKHPELAFYTFYEPENTPEKVKNDN